MSEDLIVGRCTPLSGGSPYAFIRDSIDESVVSERPTTVLRFSREGRLQQRWAIETFKGGKQTAADFEWRDVPTETQDD